jgi:hypothetical protein
MLLNEEALAFEDKDRGMLKESYFSDYIMPTVPHTPWDSRTYLYHWALEIRSLNFSKPK